MLVCLLAWKLKRGFALLHSSKSRSISVPLKIYLRTTVRWKWIENEKKMQRKTMNKSRMVNTDHAPYVHNRCAQHSSHTSFLIQYLKSAVEPNAIYDQNTITVYNTRVCVCVFHFCALLISNGNGIEEKWDMCYVCAVIPIFFICSLTHSLWLRHRNECVFIVFHFSHFFMQ